MNILLAAATAAEIAPLTKSMAAGWEQISESVFSKDDKKIHLCLTGVGMMATAYHLTKKNKQHPV